MTRSLRSARQAGSAFERLVADYLATVLDDRIDRRVKHGAKDRGDIGGVRTITGDRVVIECKNVSRDGLPGWIDEAQTGAGNDDAIFGVVAHKRRGKGQAADQFVTMRLEDFATLLRGGVR